MISVRSAALACVVLASAFLGTVATAHSHHHHDDGHHHGTAWGWGNFGEYNDQSKALQQCLCWNTTSNTWCHDKGETYTGAWRKSCQSIIYYNYWWAVLVVIWCMWLFCVPFFQCIFRICCNCCGGRNPSYGCCCPYNNKLMSQDPNFKRPYGRCATWFAKIFAVSLGCAFLSLSIHAIISNGNVSTAVQQSTLGLSQGLTNLEYTYSAVSSSEYEGLSNQQNISSWYKFNTANIQPLYQSYMRHVDSVQNGINKVRNHERQYRSHPTIKIIAIPLALVMFVSIFCLCNMRSWPVSISAGLISIMAIVIVILASVTIGLSQGVNVLCDHIPTVENFTRSLLSGSGCDMPTITESINGTQIGMGEYMCSDLGLKDILAKRSPSVVNFCEDKLNAGFATSTYFPGKWVVNSALLKNIMTSAEIMPTSSGKSFMTITTCSVSSVNDCPDKVKAMALLNFYNSYFELIFSDNKPMELMYRANYKCNIVHDLYVTSVGPYVCTNNGDWMGVPKSYTGPNLLSNLQSLGFELFGMAIVATFLYWAWMDGAKRFTKASSQEEILAAHHQFMYPVDQPIPAAGYQAMADVEGQKFVATPAPHLVAAPVSYGTAVSGTTAQPLLLSHETPNYNGEDSVNVPPAKAQPEPL